MDSVSSAALVDMIDHAYAAALDPGRWNDFLKSASDHFRCASTILYHTDKNDDRCNVFASHRYEAPTLQSLQDHYYSVNPWVPKKMLMPSGHIHRTEALYPEPELVKTEFYSDWLVPSNLYQGFGISLFNDRRFGFLSILRSRQTGPPSTDELRLLELLTPHLQRAVQLHERFRPPVSEYAAPALAVLDQLSRGVIFVGRDRHAHHANRAASRILSNADGLFLDRTGALRTSRSSDQTALDRLIEGAIVGRWREGPEKNPPASGGAIVVARPSGSRPYCVVVAPMPSPSFGLAAAHIAAAVLVSDPDAAVAARHDLLRRLYQLSDKEAQLAVRISGGESLETAARSAGITYETARSYLKNVFAKFGINRQAELASLVQRLPDEG